MAVDPQIMSALSVDVATTYGVVIDPTTVAIQVDLRTPLYDRITSVAPRRLVHPRQAAIYSMMTAADWEGGGHGAFPAGGDPYSINPNRAVFSKVKKSYGASGGVKDIDIIASTMPGAPVSIDRQRFEDDAALVLELLYARTMRSIDRSMAVGDSAARADEFDGIETQITSETVDSSFYLDVSGTAFQPAMLDEVVLQMMHQGVFPTAIYTNSIIHKAINDGYQTRNNASINLSDNQTGATAGLWITSVVTPAGRLPIISDPFFSIGGVAPSYTGSIRLVTEYYDGIPILYPEWQILPMAIPLGRVMGRGRATTAELAVWSHLVLVEKTQGWAHGLIENVAVTAQSTWSNPAA